ncbi:hypothetical protein EUBC25_04740 [Claveliimonas bilis]|uniref:hypothetical protein n=1 Tax=Claveliimonas bilis TaxID=3028070 RepID=UPI001E65BA2E|nr:hypothetical protein [Claveliimonas bilis]BCZ26387.1 hypothetical protein EUBC25_04740 [Claveliimonas bilis]
MKKKYSVVIAVVATVFAVVIGRIALDAEQTKPAPDPEPIEIQIPEPCRYGFVMIRTPEGNQTMYSSSIDIQNDGRDGKAIYIVLDKGVIQQ